MRGPSAARLRRLAEELEESGLPAIEPLGLREMLLEEIEHALRPTVHERRVATSGTILEPRSDPETWSSGTNLDVTRALAVSQPLEAARRFADGLSSWMLRRTDGAVEWVVFDRPAGSERDLVVLASVFDAVLVQRHPAGLVRVVGDFGVLRWNGLAWHHEPPLGAWIDMLTACSFSGAPEVIEALLEFAVHDLGAAGIGSLLIYRPNGEPGPRVEELGPPPPPLNIRRAEHLAPLRHALALLDGGAVFDHDGRLRQLGVRLVPSAEAETAVDSLGGTRHTSARRYSYDDPLATVIAVSEDGPVSVLRHGELVGRSPDDD
jgi:hypothetical protein